VGAEGILTGAESILMGAESILTGAEGVLTGAEGILPVGGAGSIFYETIVFVTFSGVYIARVVRIGLSLPVLEGTEYGSIVDLTGIILYLTGNVLPLY
jgi:hypothetical protein